MPFTWNESIASPSYIRNSNIQEIQDKIGTLETLNVVPVEKSFIFPAGERPFAQIGNAVLNSHPANLKIALDKLHDYRSDVANPCKIHCSGICTSVNTTNYSTVLYDN